MRAAFAGNKNGKNLFVAGLAAAGLFFYKIKARKISRMLSQAVEEYIYCRKQKRRCRAVQALSFFEKAYTFSFRASRSGLVANSSAVLSVIIPRRYSRSKLVSMAIIFSSAEVPITESI